MARLWKQLERLDVRKGKPGPNECCEIARKRGGVARDVHHARSSSRNDRRSSSGSTGSRWVENDNVDVRRKDERIGIRNGDFSGQTTGGKVLPGRSGRFVVGFDREKRGRRFRQKNGERAAP